MDSAVPEAETSNIPEHGGHDAWVAEISLCR